MKKLYLFLLALTTFATTSFAQITSTASGGNWSNTGTWIGGVVPNNTNDVIIANGATVTINTAASALSVTVGQGTSGILQFEATTARTLTVTNNVTVAAGATFRSSATGTQTGHLLSLGGSLTNNGTLDFSTNGNVAAASIRFTGGTSQTFGGTGTITDINAIEIDKGTGITPVLELNSTNFTFRGLAFTPGDGEDAFLTLTNGTFKLSGTFTVSNGLFAGTGIYNVPATARIWLNNPNYTVVARNANAEIDGTLQVDAGTYNIGVQDGNRLAYRSGTAIVINGGTVNLASRMTSIFDFGLSYTQTGGTFNVNTVASSSGAYASFDMRGGDGSTFTMSGGTICIQNANTNVNDGDPKDYSMYADVINITGGAVQFGNANTVGAQDFYVQGEAPGVTIDNTVPGHTVTLQTLFIAHTATNIKAGTTLITDGFIYRQNGPTFTNSGTFNGSTPGSSLVFFAAATQTLNGDGVFTAPLNQLIVNNAGGLAIMNSIPSEINIDQLIMANGNINAGVTTISLGTSAASPGTFNYVDVASIIVGKFKRWIGASTGLREFPVGTSVSKRNVAINFTTAPTTGGTLTAEWVNAASGNNGLPLTQGSINVNVASSQGYWTVTAGDGLTGGVYTGSFTATSLSTVNDYTRLVLLKRTNSSAPWTLNGTHVTTTGDNTVPVLSRTGMTGFSDFGVGSDVAVNPLPITIENFSGRKQTTNNLLDWRINCTSSPSVSITLERSTDGRSFATLNTQTATAVRCQQPFSYSDATATAAVNYYRLKVTDVDGKITYSPIIAVLNKEKGFEIVSLMPNIVASTTLLNVSSAAASKFEIVVTDMTGKTVSRQTLSLAAGSNQVLLNFSNLMSGAYNISGRTSDGQIKTIRFVKQ